MLFKIFSGERGLHKKKFKMPCIKLTSTGKHDTTIAKHTYQRIKQLKRNAQNTLKLSSNALELQLSKKTCNFLKSWQFSINYQSAMVIG